jgi:hypothetical protein
MARNFSVVVDTASRGAVLRGSTDLSGSLRLRAAHNTKVRPLIARRFSIDLILRCDNVGGCRCSTLHPRIQKRGN